MQSGLAALKEETTAMWRDLERKLAALERDLQGKAETFEAVH
jgi:hypothetical protein